MPTEVCLLDLDDVLVDFKRGVQETLKIPQSRFDEAPKPLPWDWIWSITDVSRDDFWGNITARWWEELHWTEEGPDILSIVEEIYGRENVCLLTSPSQQESGYVGKYRWIKKHLPRYLRRTLMGCAKHFCAGPRKKLIDDKEENINNFIAAGGEGLLVPRLWNRLHKITDVRGYVRRMLENNATQR